MNFPIQRGAEVKNRSIITAPNVVVRHKKKTHIIVKAIHSSLRSESKKKSVFLMESKYYGILSEIKNVKLTEKKQINHTDFQKYTTLLVLVEKTLIISNVRKWYKYLILHFK